MLNEKIFCLQGDISKYFESVDHEILLKIIQKKIADEKALWLIKRILDSTYGKRLGVGIPIGNLTSQLFANIYLNELDQFIKRRLKIKYYIRYMDDFLILGKNKKELHLFKKKIRNFLKSELELELHPKKSSIFPVDKGIDFLGYRICGGYRLLRKSTVKRFVRRIRKGKHNQQSIQSWLGYAKFGDSWRLRRDLSLKYNVDLID